MTDGRQNEGVSVKNLEEALGDEEFWTPKDLAGILGLSPDAVTHHCRRLFPNNVGRYRFSRVEAVRILRYVRKVRHQKNRP